MNNNYNQEHMAYRNSGQYHIHTLDWCHFSQTSFRIPYRYARIRYTEPLNTLAIA